MAVPELADSELTNAQELSGAVAVVKRIDIRQHGFKNFGEPVLQMQHHGITAVIVVNTENEPIDRMGTCGDITIPVISVASSVGADLVNGAEVHLVKGAAIKAIAAALNINASITN